MITCKGCGSLKIENRDSMLCASCNRLNRKAENVTIEDVQPIKRISDKQKQLLSIYVKEKAKWIKGKRCAVYRNLKADDIHHMQGKIGFADEWARENDVPLLLDKRFWLPVSRVAHTKITADSKWACENGYSLLRVTDPVFRKR